MDVYCAVVCGFIGRGWTQEISWIRFNNRMLDKWKDQSWIDYLNHMDSEGWELVSTTALDGKSIIVAYFKRKEVATVEISLN